MSRLRLLLPWFYLTHVCVFSFQKAVPVRRNKPRSPRCVPINYVAPVSLLDNASGIKTDSDENPESKSFDRLLSLIDQDHSKNIRLDEAPQTGVRGVFMNQRAKKGDTLLTVPLSHCLKDSKPPCWILERLQPSNEEHLDENDSLWASRLAACILDNMLQIFNESTSSKEKMLWFSLLPDPSYLRASLPIHWPESILSKAKCTAMELAVDSSFFSRAQAVHDLMESIVDNKIAEHLDLEEKRIMVNNALDLVQTRSCRVEGEDGKPLRLFAPLFDFINHDPNKINAEFGVVQSSATTTEGSISLVVRALKDIPEDEEIFIDYGASARPDWRCLSSYGFVPNFQPGNSISDGDHTAEVFLEGQRFEVGPDSVSEAMVFAMASVMGEVTSEDSVVLTPSIALRLAQRISEAAFQILLLDDDRSENDTSAQDGSDSLLDLGESPETVISERLAASLRWNQHRILIACSLGLRDWAMKQS